MRLAGKPLTNIYEPQTKGFRIYDFGNTMYAACRTIEKNTITKIFCTLDDCYAFLKKHERAIIEERDQDSPLALPAGKTPPLVSNLNDVNLHVFN
jgi:hypothetical protein